MDQREAFQLFEQYLNMRLQEATAVTIGQQLEVVRALQGEAQTRGLVPFARGQTARLPAHDPAVRAVLEGRTVSLGGEQRATARGRRQMSTAAKLGIMGAAALLPLLLIGLLVGIRAARAGQGEPTPTAEVTAVITSTVTTTPSPTTTLAPTGTITLTLPTPTATPFNVSLYLAGDAASGGNDPASLEIAGYTYMLSKGAVKNGIWELEGSQWLAGSEVRRVVGVPYSPELANAIQPLTSEDVAKLRLRSGEVVTYTVVDVARVKRHEIETLTVKEPSMAVVLCGERAGERWVVVGEALQKPEDFIVYTPPMVPPTATLTETEEIPVATPRPVSTLIPAVTQTVVMTDTLLVTNDMAGLALRVNECRRVVQIGSTTPEKGQWQFVVCQVTFHANRDGAIYSGLTLSVTELGWITSTEGWWPPSIDVMGEGIGHGTLLIGDEVSGKVAGIVNKKAITRKSSPCVVWEQAGSRYILDLSGIVD